MLSIATILNNRSLGGFYLTKPIYSSIPRKQFAFPFSPSPWRSPSYCFLDTSGSHHAVCVIPQGPSILQSTCEGWVIANVYASDIFNIPHIHRPFCVDPFLCPGTPELLPPSGYCEKQWHTNLTFEIMVQFVSAVYLSFVFSRIHHSVFPCSCTSSWVPISSHLHQHLLF